MTETANLMCLTCGLCCSEMNSPPFIVAEIPVLTQAAADSYTKGMERRFRDGWPDGVPCFWRAEHGCKFYDQRPAICREEIEPGDDACEGWRERLTETKPKGDDR